MSKTQLIILAGLALFVLVVCLIVSVLALPLLIPGQASSPATAPEITPTAAVLTFTGEGDDFVTFDNPKTGLAAFGIMHAGEHFFSVTLNDANGRMVDLLAIDRGRYEGESVERIERGGYVLEIKADGPWVIVIGLPE